MPPAAKKKNAEISNENTEAGTPPEVTKFGRYVMGGIDLDPASSDYFNFHGWNAPVFYTKETDGLQQRWFGRVGCNPPGTTDDDRIQGSVPRLFWERGLGFWKECEVLCMFWVGFNMSQLQVLQHSPAHPLQFPTLFPQNRLDYLERPWEARNDPHGRIHRNHTDGCEGDGEYLAGRCLAKCRFGKVKQIKVPLDGPPRKQGAPPRPSYITFVPPREQSVARPMMERFVEGASRPDLGMVPGAIVWPRRIGW